MIKVNTVEFDFSLENDSVLVQGKLLPFTFKFAFCFALICMLPFSILCFGIFLIFSSGVEGLFYVIIFILTGGVLIAYYVKLLILSPRMEAKTKFVIDESGVTHTAANATYHLNWGEVVAWGYVNDNWMAYVKPVKSMRPQICLYFSKEEHTEGYLRKKFQYIPTKRYSHASSDNMLVLCFYENEIEQELYDHINSVIYTYCEKSKQRDFIREKENL